MTKNEQKIIEVKAIVEKMCAGSMSIEPKKCSYRSWHSTVLYLFCPLQNLLGKTIIFTDTLYLLRQNQGNGRINAVTLADHKVILWL